MIGDNRDEEAHGQGHMAHTDTFSETWIARFAGLAELSTPLRHKLVDHSSVLKIPAGTTVFGPGKTPDYFLLLLRGTVRVQKTSANGREIVLYRVSAGESCVLTTACLLADENYLAEGITESDIEVVTLSRAAFDELVAVSDIFRKFVFNAYSSRLTDLVQMIDEIAFSRIDIRLAQRLTKLADSDGRLAMTHQALAQELGTAREVISRQLLEFQRRGWISVSRGQILLSNRDELQRLADSH